MPISLIAFTQLLPGDTRILPLDVKFTFLLNNPPHRAWLFITLSRTGHQAFTRVWLLPELGTQNALPSSSLIRLWFLFLKLLSKMQSTQETCIFFISSFQRKSKSFYYAPCLQLKLRLSWLFCVFILMELMKLTPPILLVSALSLNQNKTGFLSKQAMYTESKGKSMYLVSLYIHTHINYTLLLFVIWS